MSRATLAVLLSRVKPFSQPRWQWEQYVTPSEAAATILWDAQTRGLLEGRTVLDLGAGTGRLGIGALLLGAEVIFVEKDASLHEAIEENIRAIQETIDHPLP